MQKTSPPFISDYIFKWLEKALDFGISEQDYWNMTLAELERLVESKQRIEKARAQERASFDYILADLIGRSIARVHSSSAKMPVISEVYPTLFDNQAFKEQQQNKLNELSALRFKLFAEAHNKKFKEGAELNE